MATSVSPEIQTWQDLARQLRADSIRATSAAGSGHPTSSMSAADLMAVLLAKYLRYDFSDPHNPNNDHLIFSKGHASPLLYALFKAAGAISDQELMTLRKFGSRLEGHPVPKLPWVDVASGSLGQGLPVGVGIAFAGKNLDKLPYRVWVLLGDGEMAEGSVWEALNSASHYGLDNLVAVLDVNRLGQSGPTAIGWNTDVYTARARAFGWKAIEIDGHNLEEIDRAYAEATKTSGQPTLVVARTIKGKGAEAVENKNGQHGKPLAPDVAKETLAELGAGDHPLDRVFSVAKPAKVGGTTDGVQRGGRPELPRYDVGSEVPTRRAFGDALLALGKARPNVVVLDGDVQNSTYTEDFAKAYPERFFESYIAEQLMIGAAVGFQVRGYNPYAATFAAFLTRAYDFIRMAAVSRAKIRLCGSHAGISIGEDGASQMGLEDLAMFRAVHGSIVLYPCDGNQTAQLVALMADHPGIAYIRTTREKTPVLYQPTEDFRIGGSRVLRHSDKDQATIVAAGITVGEALKAYDQLKSRGILVRVIDAYSVKPIDRQTLHAAAREAGGKILTVEDHWPEGGLGDAVLDAFTSSGLPMPQVVKAAVPDMPSSGKPAELLHWAGIDADGIAEAMTKLLGR